MSLKIFFIWYLIDMTHKIEIYGFVNKGYSGQKVLVETDIKNGFPAFDIIGLPDTAIKESKERLKSAIKNSGFNMPKKRILVSLSPASQPKSGSLLDLSIGVSLLLAFSNINENLNSSIKIMLSGELTLTGKIVNNSSALACIHTAISLGCNYCFVPFDVSSLNYNNIFCASSLKETLNIIYDLCKKDINTKIMNYNTNKKSSINIFSDIIGMDREKEILSISACGFHSILLFGPPGVGKTMLSFRLGKLLPSLSSVQKEELNRIYGCADIEFSGEHPIRLLNTSVKPSDFIGNTSKKLPGEGALSHRGTLILDELNKYTPNIKSTIKTCYDRGYTLISRNGETMSYPSRFLIVANMNVCSCGALGSNNLVCTCTNNKILNFWNNADRTLIERLNIKLPVEEHNTFINSSITQKNDSYYISRIEEAKDRQEFRYKDIENVSFNGEVHYNTSALVKLNKESEILHKLSEKDVINVSNPRNQINLITLGRSIADYNNRENATEEDIIYAYNLSKYGINDFYWKKIY